ncbi:lytic murein transglycosylase B [Azohydromonas caseinilytica]|uniref:Lytic murein transglycosylase B n=1 Tax=Azohydromonas caseinilytica TaxID=2728836 RepID=A0A848FH32_9BURK|nr:lytic murein transglycosylase B [Azohydromonas caseinilytica]NML17500.1 lytic murein transglycosylase B [Azohydromonas caseinilytica]
MPCRTPLCAALAAAALLSSSLLLSACAAPQAEPKAQAAAAKTAKTPKTRVAAAPRTVRNDSDPDIVTYGRREDVMRIGAEIAGKYELDEAWVQQQLAQARYLPSVARLIMPPPVATAKNWAAYRARFVEPRRIAAGREFWAENERWLAQAEARWGVPASLVVGIIGVETYYGRNMGSFRVLDALATLSFDFPSGRSDRSGFFRDELAQLLVWSQREGLDPAEVRGSYAGAIGLPQFMPGSINRYAVDFDGDGHIDLINSTADAIGSVAHYLHSHGWQPGLPTHFSVAPPEDRVGRATLLAPDILPTFTPAQFAEHGAALERAARELPGPLALVELFNGDAAPSYVAGTQNFYAVTRYNWSSYYALAVIELGQAVAAER